MSDFDPAPLVQALSAACSAKGYALRIVSADDHGPARIIASDLGGRWLALTPSTWTANDANVLGLIFEIEAGVAAMPESRRIVLSPPKPVVPTDFD